MAQPDQSLPSGGRRREENAQLELENTVISRFSVRLLLAFFLLMIALVPIAEWTAVRAGRAEAIGAAWSRLFHLPAEIRSSLAAALERGPWPRLRLANHVLLTGFVQFERALEDEALISRALRPSAQVLLTRWLGAGNEQVYPGLDGWLFYRPDVEYITGRPFLSETEFERRVAATPQWDSPPQPDPRPAIVRLKRDLEARGIALIVMPTPVKPGVHPEQLASQYVGWGGVLHNASHAALLDDLQRAGVAVFDPSDTLAGGRAAGPQYLATDTHWRPEAMELVAERLAAVITASGRLAGVSNPGYRLERAEVRNTGDTHRMLDLPRGSTLFPDETVWVRRVLQADGSPWRSSPQADVLVLGDSFSNMYSLESLGWGTSAGLVEQLSYVLSRPIDRLVQNDQGAFATRAMLQREPDRLNGKRLVLYQFATRELAAGNWKVLPLATAGERPPR